MEVSLWYLKHGDSACFARNCIKIKYGLEVLNMENPLAEHRRIFRFFNYEYTDSTSLQKHIDNVSRFATETNWPLVIFDNVKNTSVYFSPGYRDLFGENNDEVHPDDYEAVLNCALIVLRYLLNNNLNIADYRLIRKYRAKVKGQYLVVIEQNRVIEFDKLGHPWLSLMLVDISPNQHFTGLVQFQLLNFVTGEVEIPFQNVHDKSSQILSSRELEILRCIENGLVSKEIAEKLQITLNTVNTHRQHILEKLNVRTSLEAVRCALAMGIL